MSALVAIVVANAACAAVLAIPAFLASRFGRRPALAHPLWLLVALKLGAAPLGPPPPALLPGRPGVCGGCSGAFRALGVAAGPAAGAPADAGEQRAPRFDPVRAGRVRAPDPPRLRAGTADGSRGRPTGSDATGR